MPTRSTKPNKPLNTATLPADKQNKIISAEWSGPLPPPRALAEFDQVVPGGAERIFHMAEIEQAHRHSVDNKELQAQVSAIRRGQWLGALISIASLLGALVSVYWQAHWSVPLAFLGLPIMSVVRAFLNKN